MISLLTERKVDEAGVVLAKDIYNPDLSSNIIEAMGKLKFDTPDIIKALIGFLGDTEPYIRQGAIRALGLIGNQVTALPISKLLSDVSNVSMHTMTTAELAAETLLKFDTPVANDKAADYYIERLQASEYDSGEWHSAEIKLDRINTPKVHAAVKEIRELKIKEKNKTIVCSNKKQNRS